MRFATISKLLILAYPALGLTLAMCQTQKVLHNFGTAGDGAAPEGTVIFDSYGNLFGTTDVGGAGNCGSVFEVSPAGGGNWNESVIDSFQNGFCNSYAPVAQDSQGNLYAVTLSSPDGGGAVLQLTLAGGSWTQTVVHDFNTADGGSSPEAPVIADNQGHLYGTALEGGPYGRGVAYEITLQPSPTYSVIYAFGGPEPVFFYGYFVNGSLLLDGSGNLYGVTENGGLYQQGTIFRLKNGVDGWFQTPLYSFGGLLRQDGAQPFYGLVSDALGSLYGTAPYGGGGDCNGGCGVVYKLSKNPSTSWTESVIYEFQGGEDGSMPYTNLTFDTRGNLYGTTQAGGEQVGYYGHGTVFKLTSGPGGQWNETILYRFTGGDDGGQPFGAPAIDSAGNLYGTAQNGGTMGKGVVWEVIQ